MFEIDLGDRVKDTITKYIGTVTARAEYLNGCIQYLLEGNEVGKELWFDEDRLKVTKRANPEPKVRLGGGIRSKPSSNHPHITQR